MFAVSALVAQFAAGIANVNATVPRLARTTRASKQPPEHL